MKYTIKQHVIHCLAFLLLVLCLFPLTVQAALRAHYTFEAQDGADATGNANTLTMVNGPTFGAGAVGTYALTLDGTDDHATAAYSATLAAAGDLTVAACVKTTTTVPGGLFFAVAARYSTSAQAGFFLYITQTHKVSFDGRDGSGSYRSSTAGTTSVDTGAWFRVFGQRAGSVWKAGVGSTVEASADVTTTGSTDSGGVFHVGVHRDGAGALQRHFPGSIDDVRFYNHALDSTELAALPTCGGPPPVTNRRVTTTEEFVGPFTSWKNVVTDYGATGNGTTDDTTAIQNGLNALGGAGVPVLYFPAGTYKVSSTLTVTDRNYVRMIGAHPETTILKWYGSAAGTMFFFNGLKYSALTRMTLDGSTTAGILIDQAWDGVGDGTFDTGNDYSDNIFKDAGTAIRGAATAGGIGYGFAETTVERSDFLRLTTAGITMHGFNALDLWVWEAYFEDCALGIANDVAPHDAGNFRVFSSFFRNSTTADLRIGNTGNMSARFNTSLGSNRFLLQSGTQNPNFFILHGNIILDSDQSSTISGGNHGPLYLVDNKIRSLAGATAPIVNHGSTGPSSDVILVGNTFTVASPIAGSHRRLEIDTTVVAYNSTEMVALGEPSLSKVPILASPARTVYEAATAGAIQTQITAAQANNGSRPIVHIPAGTYNIATTITIPAGSDVQLVGDGYGKTILAWTGSAGGTLLSLPGPSKATLRDFQIDANDSKGIVGTNLNQVGGHIYANNLEMREGTTHNFLANDILDTLIDLRNIGSNSHPDSTQVAIKADHAKIHVYSGGTGSQTQTYTVANGGIILARDMWYETNQSTMPGYINVSGQSGTLFMEAQRVATPGIINQATPLIHLGNFTGQATFVGIQYEDRIIVDGVGTGASVLGLGLSLVDPTDLVADHFQNNATPPADMRRFGSRDLNAAAVAAGQGSVAWSNVGTEDATWIKNMLALSRNAIPPVLAPTAPGVTDLRMFHIWVTDTTIGVHLQGVASTVSTLAISANLAVAGHINTCATNPTGGTDAYACALDSHLTALVPKACYGFVANVANTDGASIDFSGLGAKTITKAQGGITTPLATNDIRAGMLVQVCYDGTQMQCQNCFGASTATALRSIVIPAGSMDVTGGCITNDPAALVTNGPRLPTITCINDNAASIEFNWVSPDAWNAGTITVQLHAFNTAAETTALRMHFAGVCVSSGDALAAYATTGEVAATVTWTNATNREVFGTTGAITLQGTCAAGDHVYMRGQVDTAGTTTANMATVRILGVKVRYSNVTASEFQ